MTPGQASQTAIFVAIQRAHHFLFAPEPKLLEDNLAMLIAGMPDAAAVKNAMAGLTSGFSSLGGPEVVSAFMLQIEHAVCIRSRLAEARLIEGLKNGLGQLVILGAGLDTIAYRHAEKAAGIKIFEVDHPDTQVLKKAALERSEIPIPENLQFTAFDFNRQTLAEAMRLGGIDPALPTLFTWLGVHMYLTDETVKATFSALGNFARGSELVMDFMPVESVKLADAVEDSIAELRKVVEQMGEPMKSRYSQSELDERLRTAGFNEVIFYDSVKIVNELLGGARSSYCMADAAVSTLVAKI
jgi:methyltransferase (TIGR00027 family)